MYFSLAKFQFVSCNLSLAMIRQMTHTHKLLKLCSDTLKASLVPTKHKPIPFLKVYSPIPKCICSISFNLTRLQVTKNLRNISLRSRHLRTKSLKVLLWPKPDVNIPNIFDRFHPWTSDFQISMRQKYWRFRLTFEIVKVRLSAVC